MDKLDKLKKKILAYKEKHKPKTYGKATFLVKPLTIALEIVAAIAVGLFVGYYLDKLFELRFLFKIVCAMLAFFASLVNLYRMVGKH